MTEKSKKSLLEKSCIVISLAGRDKGRLFFVMDVDEGFAYIADGKLRKAENPKRKKLKHLRFVANSDSHAARKLRSGERVQNREIRRGLSELNEDMSFDQDKTNAVGTADTID